MELKKTSEVVEIIGKESRHLRIHHLELTLKELSELTGLNLKTLSGFEHGRSTNLYIFYLYYALTDVDGRIQYLKNILERIESDGN